LITGDRQQAVELIRQVQDSAVEGIDRTTRGTALVAVRALARRGIAEISDLLVGDAMLERFVEAERKYLTDPPAAELRARIIDQIEQVATHATDRSKLRRQMAAIYQAAGDAGQAQRLLASALDDAREVEDDYRRARCLAELAACNLSLDDIESEIAGLPESQWRLCALAELASVLFDKGQTERGESLIKDALIPCYSAWQQREGSRQSEQDAEAGKMRLLEMLFSDSKWLAESLARLAAAVASHQWSGSDALADWAEQAALESASREQTGAFRGVQPFIDVARRYLDRGLKNRALTPLQAAWDRAGALEELSSASGVGQVTELALLLKESGDTSLVDRLPRLLRDLAEQSPDFYVLTVVAKALAGIGDHDGALRFFWRGLDEALAAEPEERARRLAEISRCLGDSLTLEQATSLYGRLREEAELLTSRTRLACYTVLPDLAGAFHKNGDHDACQALLQKALVEASRPDETSSYPLQSVVETLDRYYEPDHGPSMLIELGDAIARSVFEARDAPSHRDVGDMLEYLSFLGEYGGDEPSPLAGLYGAVGERLARAAESPERGRLLSDLEDRIVARDSRVDAVHFFTCVGRGAACAGRGETARRAFTLAALSASGGFLTLIDELGRACLQAGDGGWARPVYDELVSRIGKHPQPSTCREIARAAAGLRRIGFRWTALKMALRALRATKACKDDEQLHGQLIHVARDLHEAVGGWASRRLLNKAERFFLRRPDDRKKFEYLTEVMDGWLATGRKDRAEALGDRMKGSLLSNPTLLPAKTYASTIVVGDLTGARSGWLEEMLEGFSADPFGGFHLEVSKLIDGLISTVGDLVDPALRVEKLLVIAGRLPSIIPDPTFRQPLETRLYRSLARSDGNRLLEVLRRLEPPDTRLAVVKAAADEIGSQPGRAGKWEVILALLIEALGARYAMYPVLGSVIRLASDDQVEAVAQVVLSQ
jgi:tetratricopeptide (TPR) repeat protein